MMQVMTLPEQAVSQALTRLGIAFESQKPFMGGRQLAGGTVIDFFLPELNIAIFVNGLYWHYHDPADIAKDKLIATALESQGVKVVFIDEDHAMTNATFYVSEALVGMDHSRMNQ